MERLVAVLTLTLLHSFIFAKESRPNVVFILCDDQGPESIGCYKGLTQTPHIDSLAQNGILFEQAQSVSTICSPSRYNILTGRYYNHCTEKEFLKHYPKKTASCVTNNISLEPDLPNLAAILQENGYKTGFIGKFHLTLHSILHNNKHWKENGLQTYPHSADPINPDVSAKMKHNHDWWAEQIKKFGFDSVNGVYAANTRELFNDKSNHHNVEYTIHHALNFIEQQNANPDPFFLFFSTTISHGPGPGWVRNGKYQFCLDADPAYTPEGYRKQKYPFMPNRASFKPDVVPQYNNDNIYPMSWWDSGVGAIINKLEELKLRDNTIIIYTADHGLRNGGKTTLYESGTHVPLIINWPNKISTSRKYKHIIGSVDYTPTLLDLCQAKIPSTMKMDGVSYKDVILGKETEHRKHLLLEMGYTRAIRTNGFKYISIRYPEEIEKQIRQGTPFKGWKGDSPMKQPYLITHKQLAQRASKGNPNYFSRNQLYNLSTDPNEQNNIYNSMPEKAAELKKILSSILRTNFPERPFGEFN